MLDEASYAQCSAYTSTPNIILYKWKDKKERERESEGKAYY